MPRVTIAKQLPDVETLPTPEAEPFPGGEEVPLSPPLSEGNGHVSHVTRELRTVLIEAPLCVNPPQGIEGRRPHVNFNLIPTKSRVGRDLLYSLYWALRETEAALRSGRPVKNRNDAVIWLIEQLGGQDAA